MTALAPVPPGRVTLEPSSVFAPAQARMLHLARTYPVDRALAVFRANAGLDTRGAPPPGTWEDHGHPQEEPWSAEDYPGREHARTANLLRGHYAGHLLSMLAKAHAATGEELLREKAHALVAGLAEVQQALAATGRCSHPGFLAAYGEWQFSRLEDLAPYGEIWAPYYTTHKIMAGLLDAHELTGSSLALEVLEGMGRWVHHRLAPLDPEHRQRMWSLYIAGEFGGMNETLARLAALTGEAVFLQAAQLFDQENLLEAGAAGRDVLDGMHANQHLPQLIGYLHEHDLTGEDRYLRTAIALFDQVVPGRMYAHGGSGESELWGPAGTVAGDIGHRNAETCVAYNLVKLARLLLARTGEEKYAAYLERALTNQVAGSRRAVDSEVSPEVTYMFPVHPGAVREYDNAGTCCGGTGLENHVTYQEALALEGPGQLWLPLLTDAEIDAPTAGLRLRMRTEGPFGGRSEIEILDAAADADADDSEVALHLRIPRWSGAGARVRVLPADAAGIGPAEASTAPAARPAPAADAGEPALQPGSFHVVHRRWRAGDRVEIDFPAAPVARPTLDDPDLHSIEAGPTVWLARSEQSTTLGLPLRGLRRLDGTLAGARIAPDAEGMPLLELAGLAFEPTWSGAQSRYHLYVRAADDEVAFAGTASGVPERRGVEGTTLLAEVWADPAPADRTAFLERVLDVAAQRLRTGLLTRDEAQAVLGAAAAADIDGPGAEAGPAPDAAPTTGSAPSAGPTPPAGPELSALLSRLPAVDARAIPPTVRIVLDAEPAASGWFTSAVHADVEVLGAEGATRELRRDEGEWQEADGPIAVPEGVHRLEARVRTPDGATAHAIREVAVDTVPPASTARVKDLGSAWEITLDAQDETSGLDRIQWEGPGTFWGTFHEAFVRTLTDTEQVIEFAATDRAGNQEPRHRLVLPARGSI